jgi:hypothetical protein
MVQGSKYSEDKILSLLHICPDWPWIPSTHLYIVYEGCFVGVKWPGCGIDHPLHLWLRFKMNRAIPLLPFHDSKVDYWGMVNVKVK